jgi:hypothetical protein
MNSKLLKRVTYAEHEDTSDFLRFTAYEIRETDLSNLTLEILKWWFGLNAGDRRNNLTPPIPRSKAMVRHSIALPIEMCDQLKMVAAFEGTDVSTIIRRATNCYLGNKYADKAESDDTNAWLNPRIAFAQ